MSLQPGLILEIPEQTVRIARAAFPKGNVFMQMRDELGVFYENGQFAEPYSHTGQPAITAWRLARRSPLRLSQGIAQTTGAPRRDRYRERSAYQQPPLPERPANQAGTLSGNPLAMTAGLATVRALLEPGVFDDIAGKATRLVEGITLAAQSAGIPLQAACTGTMFGFYFLKDADGVITDYVSAKQHANPERYGRFFHAMLEQGVYFAPSQFEAGFMSSVHSLDNIDMTMQAATSAFKGLS